MATTTSDPFASLDHVRQELTAATTRATEAEAKAAEAIKTAEGLQKEKDEHWKTQIKEAKKAHPGQQKLLKLFAASTREEWEETKAFLDMFDGHLPIGMVRLAQGCEVLLNGVEGDAAKK